ncbi:MAG TPA: zf-HC2 domain-containing protein, partial [Rugosimonospora sp.]|nr:zf-HC2 domain-containing protein [Rugosimonospora sp.]
MTHSATWHAGEMLGAYSLGVLEPGDARTIEDHLTGCVQCRAELAELAAVAGALGDVPPEAFL